MNDKQLKKIPICTAKKCKSLEIRQLNKQTKLMTQNTRILSFHTPKSYLELNKLYFRSLFLTQNVTFATILKQYETNSTRNKFFSSSSNPWKFVRLQESISLHSKIKCKKPLPLAADFCREIKVI